MTLILVILSLTLNGYFLYLLKKTNKETTLYITEVKILCETLIDDKTSYLLNEVNNEYD